MAKNKIDIIIEAFRAHLKEDAPINNVGSGNIAGTVEAGDDPPVRKKKRYIYQKNTRKNWSVG